LNLNTLASNPWAQTIVGGVAVAFIGWLFKRFFRKPGTEKSPPGNVVQHASPVVTQTFNPTINIRQPATASPRTASIATLATIGAPEKKAPNLAYAGCKQIAIYISPDPKRGISEPHTHDEFEQAIGQALIFKFENTPIPGQTVGRAMNVVAKLRFKSATRGTERVLDYGMWLDSPCESKGIEPGDTRRLLVMIRKDSRLITFVDKRGHGRFQYGSIYWEPQPVDDLASLDLTLIERNTQTAVKFAFRVWWDGGFCVTQL
jgi:hypothetical protein